MAFQFRTKLDLRWVIHAFLACGPTTVSMCKLVQMSMQSSHFGTAKCPEGFSKSVSQRLKLGLAVWFESLVLGCWTAVDVPESPVACGEIAGA